MMRITKILGFFGVLTKPFQRHFSKTIPMFTLKDFYLNRQFAKSLNPLITAFENQVINISSNQELERLLQHLIEPHEEDLPKVHSNIEFFTLILLEKIITVQTQKKDSEDLSGLYNFYYSLIFTHLANFRAESLLFLIHVTAREPLSNKRIFRIFEFVIMRTAFANTLGEDELLQLVEDCDKFYQIIEEDSFLEIFEKIEKVLFEKYPKELKLSPENVAKLIFIYSTHRVGSQEFYQKINRYFKQNFEIMVTKELVVILWSLLNSGHFEKTRMITDKLREIIENDMERMDEYYQNLYFYARKKDTLKFKRFKFL